MSITFASGPISTHINTAGLHCSLILSHQLLHLLEENSQVVRQTNSCYVWRLKHRYCLLNSRTFTHDLKTVHFVSKYSVNRLLLRVLRCGLYIMLLHTDTVNVMARIIDVQERIWEGDVTDRWALCNVFFWGDWGNSNNFRISGVPPKDLLGRVQNTAIERYLQGILPALRGPFGFSSRYSASWLQQYTIIIVLYFFVLNSPS
jgi:hypothetical protein